MTDTDRLARSRATLRQALAPAHAQVADAGGTRKTSELPARPGVASQTTNAALGLALTQWWVQQSWVSRLKSAKAVGNAALLPAAQRHPVALVLGAAALGALAVRTVPWREVLRPAHWVAWLSPLVLGELAAREAVPWAATLDALLKAAATASTPTAVQTTAPDAAATAAAAIVED